MYLTGLPRVLEDAGVNWTAEPGWETRTLYREGITAVRAVFWHTTETVDSAFTSGRPAPTLSFVLGDTKEKPYPSYNLLIGRTGTVHLIAAGASAHAGKGSIGFIPKDKGNRYAFAVSFDANESKYPVTPAQLEAAARLGAAIDREWKGSIRHVMHGEWAPSRRRDPTRIPGGWPALRAAIARGHWATPAAPATTPTTTPKEDTLSAAEVKTITEHATAQADRIIKEVQSVPSGVWRHEIESVSTGTPTAARTFLRWTRELLGRVRTDSITTRRVVEQIAQRTGMSADEVARIVKEAAAEGTAEALAADKDQA